MPKSTIRFTSFPKTSPPPASAAQIASAFRRHEQTTGTAFLTKGMTSNEVLITLRGDLIGLGLSVEAGKQKTEKIERPVFFGENGVPTLKYQIDAFHPEWRCGLEVEAGRAWMGNAIYRDLVQGLVMAQVHTLVLAVPNAYKYKAGGRAVTSTDYSNTVAVAETLFGHSRVVMPYGLLVIGY